VDREPDQSGLCWQDRHHPAKRMAPERVLVAMRAIAELSRGLLATAPGGDRP
jgi:hypothetical protein